MRTPWSKKSLTGILATHSLSPCVTPPPGGGWLGVFREWVGRFRPLDPPPQGGGLGYVLGQPNSAGGRVGRGEFEGF